jgi:hypothetical protein
MCIFNNDNILSNRPCLKILFLILTWKPISFKFHFNALKLWVKESYRYTDKEQRKTDRHIEKDRKTDKEP